MVISGPHFAPLFAAEIWSSQTRARKCRDFSLPSTVLFCSYSYILLGSSLEAANVAAAWVGFRARYTQGFFFRVIRACLQQHPVHGRCDSQLLLLQVWISCRVLLLAISGLGWLGHGLMGVYLYCVSWGVSFHRSPFPFSFLYHFFNHWFDAPFATVEVAAYILQ